MCVCDLQNEDDPWWRVQQSGRGADRPQNWAQSWRVSQAYSAVGQWTSKCRQGETDCTTKKYKHLNHTVLFIIYEELAQTKPSLFPCEPQLSKKHPWMKERIDEEEEEDTKKDNDQSEVVQKKITKWAKEIQSVSEVSKHIYII